MFCSDRAVLRPTTDTGLAWSLGPNTPTNNINNLPVSPREGDKKRYGFWGGYVCGGRLSHIIFIYLLNGPKRQEMQRNGKFLFLSLLRN